MLKIQQQRMVGRFQFDPGPLGIATEMGSGFQIDRRRFVIGDASGFQGC
jgi:hypothetical protein